MEQISLKITITYFSRLHNGHMDSKILWMWSAKYTNNLSWNIVSILLITSSSLNFHANCRISSLFWRRVHSTPRTDIFCSHAALWCTTSNRCSIGGLPRKLLKRFEIVRRTMSTGRPIETKGRCCLISRNTAADSVENRSGRHQVVARSPEQRMDDH